MQLYVIDKTNGEKVNLQLVADNRQELITKIGARSFVINNNSYDVNEVLATTGADSATISALVGGLIGALGGAPGVIAGSALGALLGSGQAKHEKNQAELFNRSSA